MEITVFKYKSNEWYQDLLSEFESSCRKVLDMEESEMVDFMKWVSNEEIHCKKELVKNLHKDPLDVMLDWEDFKKESHNEIFN